MNAESLVTWVKEYGDLIKNFQRVDIENDQILLKRILTYNDNKQFQFIYNLTRHEVNLKNASGEIVFAKIIQPDEILAEWEKWLNFVSLSVCLDVLKGE